MNRGFDSTMGELIVTALGRYPGRTAFLNPDGRPCSYRRVAQEIAHTQRWLAAQGIAAGESVAQLCANRSEIFSVMGACYLGGYRSVALSPTTSVEDLAYILDHSEARVLITDRLHLARASQAVAACGRELAIACHDAEPGPAHLWEGLDEEVAAQLVNRAAADDIVRLIYTGGTTGRPKGVMGSSGSLALNAMLRMAGHDWSGMRLLCSTPLSHAAGAMIVPVLWHGGTIVMQDGFDPARLIEQVLRGEADAIYVVPTMLYRLLDHPRVGEIAGRLRMIMYGAAPASPARLREARERFGPILTQHYGLTEAPSTILNLNEADHQDDTLLASAGKPYPGIAVQLLDPQGRVMAPGEVGEICVRGPLLMSGYWKDPELTQRSFVDGWLRSGDLAYQDPRGYYYIVDRAKDMIVSGGFNVYPKEVEDVIAQHPAVAAVAVIGVPDPLWGEAVKAIVVCRAGEQVQARTLVELVRARKGPVMAPKSVDFVAELPQTGLGKVDKKALRSRYWTDTTRSVN
jgi:fatty-acyl-CoA synthase